MSVLVALLIACKPDPSPVDTDTDVVDTDTDVIDTDTDIADTDTDTDVVDTDSDTDTPPPCTFQIPAGAIVVTSDTSITDDNVIAWVCRNKTLSYAGTGGTIFLEDRADLVLAAVGGNQVYAKSNASVHNFGSTNTFTVGWAGVVEDEADPPATVEVCTGLTFDVSGAPDPGC